MKREQLIKLTEHVEIFARPSLLSILVNGDNYLAAKSTVLDAWSDSQMKDWLVEHKYLDDRTAAQKKRDEFVELMEQT